MDIKENIEILEYLKVPKVSTSQNISNQNQKKEETKKDPKFDGGFADILEKEVEIIKETEERVKRK